MNGKGSKPRPYSVTQQEYNERWDMIFRRDLSNTEEEQQERTLIEESINASSIS